MDLFLRFRTKTEYLIVTEILIWKEIEINDCVKYLGSTAVDDGDMDLAIIRIVQSGFLKGKRVSRVLFEEGVITYM